jgi:hypothetical protein
MMVRGKRVSQWVKEEGIKKLVRHVFPGTRIWVRWCGGRDGRKYQIRWMEGASYADMRALADEIEAAVPAKAALTIECCRDIDP